MYCTFCEMRSKPFYLFFLVFTFRFARLVVPKILLLLSFFFYVISPGWVCISFLRLEATSLLASFIHSSSVSNLSLSRCQLCQFSHKTQRSLFLSQRFSKTYWISQFAGLITFPFVPHTVFLVCNVIVTYVYTLVMMKNKSSENSKMIE